MLRARNQIVTSDAERYLLVYMISVLVVISAVVFIFFVVFQKRKNQLLIDKVKQKQQFEEELVKTQQEIQEETLKHLGRELHDNVGQMLVLATMQMNAAASVVKDEAKSKVENAASALKDSLEEVRALSKSLNSDVIFNLGFDATVKNEVARLNKSGLIATRLSITGEKVDFENKKDEIILFRILQEFFSNTLKYAQAETIVVSLNYESQFLNIKVEDNGSGFDIENAEKGSGLINMEKRAELLNAKFQLESQLKQGTILNLKYPYREI
ncbi:two-component system sensor histidine kinase [Winogradskyella psychrotolerans RS-3]|uniref:Two-component system sensor histidine kinase n=1 Tax=Winogradskyella psychrotolerans RS-3 TaxID=641526 RepID=S7VMX5_9FLAO|nr:histidine kinase [Winogradskyella psychrotolerans]EPR70742.1 two-component system sensor histidine kinase [Winogradskyella psychrotolerans RS-3]